MYTRVQLFSFSLSPSLSFSFFLNKHFMEGFCTWIVPYMYVSSGTQKSCDYYNSVSLSFFPFLSSPSLSVKAGGPISMSSSSSSSISGSLSNTSMKSNTAQQQQPPQPQQQLPNPPLNLPAPPIRPPLPGLPGMHGIRRWPYGTSGFHLVTKFGVEARYISGRILHAKFLGMYV